MSSQNFFREKQEKNVWDLKNGLKVYQSKLFCTGDSQYFVCVFGLTQNFGMTLLRPTMFVFFEAISQNISLDYAALILFLFPFPKTYSPELIIPIHNNLNLL